MPAIEELGKKIKAKYPGAYDDMDDRSLALKIQSKYPGAYDDFTDVSASPLPSVTAPSITPRQPAPIAPSMQSAVDPFAPKQDWIPERPKMMPPPPPSPVEAAPTSIRPELPGPMEKVQVTSPVGQTNAPVPGKIPGMERLGGAAPGVPRPALPTVGQPPIPRNPMEEYMGPRSDEFVIADEPITPAFVRGATSATIGAAGGILKSIGESRSGSARPLPSGPNFAGLPGASEQTPAGAMAQSAGEALSAADESVQQTFAKDASIKDFMADPKGAMTDPRWWMDSVGSAAGSMLPMALSGAGTASAISRVAASRILAPEIASAAVKYGPTVAASLAESAQVYGSTYNEARKAGLDSELSREAASLVAAGTGLTAIPAHKVGIFNDQIRSVGRRIATAAVAEGGQEGVQTWWENVIAKTFYDPKRPLMQGVPEAVVGSAIVGGTMGSGGINEQTPAPPTPEMQQEFAGLERENSAPQPGTPPPPAQPIVSNDIAVPQEQKQAIPPPGAITPPPVGFVVDEEKSPVPALGTQASVEPIAEPNLSHVPAAIPVKMSFTDKSVRDFPVNAKRDGDVATVTLKLGNRKIGSFTVDKSEWPVKPVDYNRANLWRLERRELARKKISENKLGDFEADGADQAERIADAVTNALTKIFDINEVPAPGPRKEVVQPVPVGAAAPGEVEKPREFSSTQVNLPPDVADSVRQTAAKIPDEDLVEDGREDEPHTTVKFGLHTNDAEDVRPLLANEPPVKVKFGKVSLFENDDADVVKIDVDSPDLHRLNKKIADALPHTDTRPEYKPHVTLAYVKPGMGKKYLGLNDLEGQEITLNAITFSGKDRQKIEIPLGGRSIESSNASVPGQIVKEPNAPLPPETPPSPGPVEDAAPTAEPTPDPDIFRVPTQSLEIDPVRFQYKVEGIGQGGVNEELKASKKWKPALAGVISVWRDPANGKTYVVNGHHRFDLASRLKVPSLSVRYIDAPTAQEARAQGALQNIAEGRGTAVDAAKFMRDTGMNAGQMEDEGVSLKGAVAREGAALSNLAPALFNDVVHGVLPQKRAVIIGESLPDHADQMGAIEVLRDAERRGKRLIDAEVKELIRRTAQAERKVEQQDTLFGVQEMTQNLALEEAQLSNFVRSRLGNEKKLFSAVGSQSAADRLGAVGNKIDADANKQVAEQADQALAVYDKLSLSAGPISDALRDGARRIANGEKLDAVKEGVYASVRDSVTRLLGGAGKQATGSAVRSVDAGANQESAGRIQEGSGKQKPATRSGRGNTVDQTPDGPQETLVTDIEARESQLSAKRDRTTPLAEVPFSLVQEDAPTQTGPDERQESMFGDESGTASYAPDARRMQGDARGKGKGNARMQGGGVANAQPRTPSQPPATPKGGPPKQPKKPTTKTQISRGEIVRDLSASLDGIPIKTGGIYGKALGVFKIRERVIRSRKALDLNTIAHEVGHAIHKYLWANQNNIDSLNHKPLMPFRKELGPLDYDQTKKRPFEGFAEYIRLRMVDPLAAQQAAPRFHAWFERNVMSDPSHADLAATIRKAEDRVQAWQKQPGTMKIAASINTQDAEQKPWMSMMERVWSDAIDDRYAIQKAVKEMIAAGADMAAAMDAYSLSRRLSGWAEKAQQFLEVNTFDANSNASTGKSFRDIVKPLYKRKKSDMNPRFNRLTEKMGMSVADDKLDDLRIYLIAKRAEDYHSQGLETGFEDAWVQEAIAATKTPAIEKAAQELQTYQNAILDYVVAKGGLSKDSAEKIRSKNSFYVPMHRVMDNSDVKFSAGGRKMIDAASPIRKRKGGAQEIVDPLESIVKNTYALISYAERNEVGQSLVKQAARASNKGSLLESGINPGMKITKFNLKEIEPQIAKMMTDAGLDPDDVDMDVVAAIYRPNTKPNKAKNQVVITVDGHPQMFEMHPDIIKAMSVTEAEAASLLVRVLQAPANVLRFGATGAGPEFVLRNPLKDTWAAYNQSRNGFRPVIDTVAGGLAMIFDKDLVNEMVRAGGGGAGIMPMGRKALRRYIDEMMMAKPQYVMHHPKEVLHILAESLRMAGEFTERATRVGEYRLARKAGKSAAEAAMDARDVTLDFSRQGAVARKINPYVAFFSASLNGTSRFFEEHANHPVRSAIRGLVGTTIPTILLWMMNKDDEQYWELEEWQRSLFWHIPTRFMPKAIQDIVGPFIPFPRANLYGLVYGNTVERILDATYRKNPKAFDGFARELLQSTTPPVLPSGVTPIAEAAANYSFFRGSNIDSRTMENLEAQYRSRPSTSSTAKAISKTFAELGFEISPLKVEHVYFGLTAGLGRAALWGAEKAYYTAKKAAGGDVLAKPMTTASDTPVLRAFTNNRYSSSSVVEFYKRMDKLRKVRDSHKSAQEIPNGPAAGARPLTDAEKSELDRMERASRELAKLSKQAQIVQYSKEMNEVEKLNALDKLHRRKVNAARVALGLKEIYRIQ